MNFTGGIILLAVAVAMVLVGRGRPDGEPRAFLSNYLIAQVYSVAVVAVFVASVAAILLNWPF